jgi:propionyl-CoA synthetase
VGLVVLKAGAERDAGELASELVASVREQIGPVAAFKRALVVDALPKTRSGKILRATMRKIADGEPYRVPATIEDASVLDQIAETLKAGS